MLSDKRLAEIKERVDSMPLLCVDDAVTNTDFRALMRHIEEVEGERDRLREALDLLYGEDDRLMLTFEMELPDEKDATLYTTIGVLKALDAARAALRKEAPDAH